MQINKENLEEINFKVCKVYRIHEVEGYLDYCGQRIAYKTIDKNGDKIISSDPFYLSIYKDYSEKVNTIIPFRRDVELVKHFLNDFKFDNVEYKLKFQKNNKDWIIEFYLNSHLMRVLLKSYQIKDAKIIDENIKLDYVYNDKTDRYEIIQQWNAFMPSVLSYEKEYDVEHLKNDEGHDYYLVSELNYEFRIVEKNPKWDRVILDGINGNGTPYFKVLSDDYFIDPSKIFTNNLFDYIRSSIHSEEGDRILEQLISKNNNYLLTLKNYLDNSFNNYLINKNISSLSLLNSWALELHEGALRYKYYAFFERKNANKIEGSLRLGLSKHKAFQGIATLRGLTNWNYLFEDEAKSEEDATLISVILWLSNYQFYSETELLEIGAKSIKLGRTLGYLDGFVLHKLAQILDIISRISSSSRNQIADRLLTVYSRNRSMLFLQYAGGFVDKDDIMKRSQTLQRIYTLDYLVKCVDDNELINPKVLYDSKLLFQTLGFEYVQEKHDFIRPRSNYISSKSPYELYLKGEKVIINLSKDKWVLELNQKLERSSFDINSEIVTKASRFEIRQIGVRNLDLDKLDLVDRLEVGEEIETTGYLKEFKHFNKSNQNTSFVVLGVRDGRSVDCILNLNDTWLNYQGAVGLYSDFMIGDELRIALKRIEDYNDSPRYVGRLLDSKFYPIEFLKLEINTEYTLVGMPDLMHELVGLKFLKYANKKDKVSATCSSCGGVVEISQKDGIINCTGCEYNSSLYIVLKNEEKQTYYYLTFNMLIGFLNLNETLKLFSKASINQRILWNSNEIQLLGRDKYIQPVLQPSFITLMIQYNSELVSDKTSLWKGLAQFSSSLRIPNSYLFNLYYLASSILDKISSGNLELSDKTTFIEELDRIDLDRNRFKDSESSINGIYLLKFLWMDLDLVILEKLKSEKINDRKISELIVLYKLFSSQFPKDFNAFTKIIEPIRNFIFHQIDSQSLELGSGVNELKLTLLEMIEKGDLIESEILEFKETLWRPVLTSDNFLRLEDLKLKLGQDGLKEARRQDYEHAIHSLSQVDQSDNSKKIVKMSTFKNICAMLNTRGGHIVIGVRDIKGRPVELVGLDADYNGSIKSFDDLIGVYQSAGKAFIKDWVTMWSQYCHPSKEEHNGKEFLVIKIDQVSSKVRDLCFIDTKEVQEVYVRTSHGAEKLPVTSIRDYKRPKTADEDVQEASVYLMSSNKTWKIGMSNDPEKRFGTLTPETKNLKLEFSALFTNRKDAFEMERHLHQLYESKRDVGTKEFFYLSFSDINEIKSILRSQIHVIDVLDYSVDS